MNFPSFDFKEMCQRATDMDLRVFCSMNMVKGRLLGRNTLSSTIIGIVPREPDTDVSAERSSVEIKS